MQKVYVVLHHDLEHSEVKVSQEGYATFEHAKQFCTEHAGPNYREVTQWVYYSRNWLHRYEIVEVTVK